jgi:glycosyltransferase involved in cell wall biosynthesis
MKLAYVTHILSPDLQIPYMIGTLGHMMMRLGNEVDIMTSSIGDPPMVTGGLRIWRMAAFDLKFITRGTEYPLLPIHLVKRTLEIIRPDILHAQSHLFLTSRSSIGAAADLGIPSVVTVHGFSVNRSEIVNLLQRLYLNSAGRDLLGKATVVHCLTKNERSAVLRLQPRAKTVVIPNGIDTTLFKPSEMKEDKKVAWVGRMIPEKGLIFLLDALILVSKEFKDFNMVFVGDGPMFEYIASYVRRHGLEKNCHLLGLLRRQVVAEILATSSVFVLPSLSEGMPYAILEAMASENAVISSDLPTIREVIDDRADGILVPPGDKVALANALCECLADPAFSKKLARNARKKVLFEFSLPTFVDRISGLYARLQQ